MLLEKLRKASDEIFADSTVMRPDILKHCGEAHDWRKHVPDAIKTVWDKLDETQRRLVMLTAGMAADAEEWD